MSENSDRKRVIMKNQRDLIEIVNEILDDLAELQDNEWVSQNIDPLIANFKCDLMAEFDLFDNWSNNQNILTISTV